jgi:hypothetical protein
MKTMNAITRSRLNAAWLGAAGGVASRPMIRLAGLFSPFLRELN